MTKKPIASALCALFAALALAACGSSSNSVTDNNGTTTGGIDGKVALANATGMQVRLYAVNADGSIATTPLASTTVDGSGSFHLPAPTQWPVIIDASGGSYTDLVSGATLSLGSDHLQAALDAAPGATVALSVYSTASVRQAEAMSGGLTASNITLGQQQVQAYLGGLDAQATLPAASSTDSTASTTAVSADLTDGQKAAFVQGVASQYQNDSSGDTGATVRQISADIGNGSTLTACSAGAGDPQDDGTVGAAGTGSCGLASSAATFVNSAANDTPVTSLAQLNAPADETNPDSLSAAACASPQALLAAYQDKFDFRRTHIQAATTSTVNSKNWRDVVAGVNSWGPVAVNYARYATPASTASCDRHEWQRNLLMAAVNYWVDQDINYCHHHIPGWSPYEKLSAYLSGKGTADEVKQAKLFLNFSSGSTGGGDSSGMKCTPSRFADGHQAVSDKTGVQSETATKASEVKWNGVDCSDFTSWVYNFAGITGNALSTGVATQACQTNRAGDSRTYATGVLLDINATNIDTFESQLQPGDLLYILDKNAAGSRNLAHVIIWTGLRWNDTQASSYADRAKFDIAKRGQVGSRLGGDFLAHGVSEANLATKNPYLIVDSHFAGPAYRPFSGWYVANVSQVRRIINARAVRQDATLAPYIMSLADLTTPITLPHGKKTETYTQFLRAERNAGRQAQTGYGDLANTGDNACIRDANFAQ
ncbi:C40 family peptidase [Chitinasiproducens palmae]|uniref:Lipoprotein n=1 Tax=Chitinasiproducens palmae TaxID=1770053 RepID=A0A1H2PKC9_9BURK|nr:hypothetical protein [Chitinasiproducens palmae]SDV46884.1 hypothetical protein SAMN05216551_10270 [Chitinasiproducens palmae]